MSIVKRPIPSLTHTRPFTPEDFGMVSGRSLGLGTITPPPPPKPQGRVLGHYEAAARLKVALRQQGGAR